MVDYESNDDDIEMSGMITKTKTTFPITSIIFSVFIEKHFGGLTVTHL